MAVSLGISITQNSQSIVNCSSNITVSVYCWWSYGSFNLNTDADGLPSARGWLNIDGVQYDFRNTFNDGRTSNGSKVLFSKTLDVAHNAEGLKTVSCSAWYATGVSSGNIAASNSLQLTDIPRYARIEQIPDFTDEENPTLQYVNPAQDNADTLQACIALEDGTVIAAYRDIPKTGDSYTFALTNTERNALRVATPNSNTLKVVFTVKTVIADAEGIDQANANMRIVNANPLLTPAVIDTNDMTKALTGDNTILIARHSIARVTLNAQAQKGAVITACKVEQGGIVLEGDGTFLVASADPLRATAIDSRGNVTMLQLTNEIVPYIDPTCDIQHTMPDGDGEMPLTVVGKAYNGSFGISDNAITVQYRSKAGYGEYGEWVTIDAVTRRDNDFVAETVVTGLDYKARHTFQARVIDAITADGAFSTEKVFIAEPIFDWSQEDFKFNVPVCVEKVTGLIEPQENTDAANKEYVDNKITEQKEYAETLKKYADTKASTTRLWKNASPTSYFPPQSISFDEDLNKYDAFLVPGITSPDWQGMGVAIAFMEHGFHIAFGDTFRNGWVHAHSIEFYNAYANGTTNDALMIPYEVYGINFGNKVEEPESDNLFDINNLQFVATHSYYLTRPPKIENGVFYSGGLKGDGVGAIAYVPVNEGDIIRFAANATGTGTIKFYEFTNPVERIITSFNILEEVDFDNTVDTHFEKTYTITAGMNYFGFAAEDWTRFALQLTDIVIQKIY